MSLVIAETDEADLDEVRRLLLGGFEEDHEYPGFLPDVLRWKYFSANDGFSYAKSFVARHNAEIVAHIGLCYRLFISGGPNPIQYLAVHPIDWYSSPKHPGAGASLMLKVFDHSPIQYVIGGTAIAKRAHKLMGYDLVAPLTLYRKMLRPFYPLLRERGNLARRLARSIRNAAYLRHSPTRTRRNIKLIEVDSFDSSVDRFSHAADSTVTSGRGYQLLNHFLNFPGGGFSGYLVQHQQICIGIAVLRRWAAGGGWHGSIADCMLATDDDECWSSVYCALVQELSLYQVEIVTTYASMENRSRQLTNAGFHPYTRSDVFLRDPDRVLAKTSPLQLSKLDADHAY